MAGTVAGGKKAAKKNKELYGDDYYVKMGEKGGLKGAVDGAIKGFAANRERARTAGAKGGSVSRRGKA